MTSPATDGALVSAIAGERHFADHLLPIYLAVPEERRGGFYVARSFLDEFRVELPEAQPIGHDGTVRGLDLAVVSAIGDVKRAPGARLVLTEHGAGQSYSSRHSSYVGGRGRERCELVLVPNLAAAGRHRRHYPAGPPVEVVGCPKLDRWVGRPRRPRSSPPLVAVSWHWQPIAAPCPEVGSAWPALGRGILDELVELRDAGEVELLGHSHPRIAGDVFPVYAELGIPVASRFDDVLDRADLYLVDNSSTLYEFAAVAGPVVVINAPQYRRLASHGLRFWHAAHVGPHVDRPADVAGAVRRALAEEPDDVASRLDAVRRAYSVLDGTSARRAAMAILNSTNAGAVNRATRPPSTRTSPAMLRTYRTATGDFRLTEASAIERGLIPGPTGLLPRAVARRLRKAGAPGDVVEAIGREYVEADDEARARYLTELALTTDNALRSLIRERLAQEGAEARATTTVIEEVVIGGLDTEADPADAANDQADDEGQADDESPDEPQEDDPAERVLDAVAHGRVGDVLDAVAGDPELAKVARSAEAEGKARTSLLAELDRIAG